jgi:UDP-hydrolysing UDP-N-acetyl-D-glucosamine 2-epimerase
MSRKVCFLTGTRADWGLLSPIARALTARPDVEVMVVATNMHLDPRFGNTLAEIEEDGMKVTATVKMPAAGDTPLDVAKATATCMDGMAGTLARLAPDMVVILGDRTEMLAAASAAAILRIPIVHISGGEISEGAIDDSIRHAITKLSALHLVSTQEYARRVIAMGESPDRVINTGSIGVWNCFNSPLMSRSELEANLGFRFDSPTAIVTFHPATADDSSTASAQFAALLAALEQFEHMKCIITYPNNDAAGAPLIDMIEDFAARHRNRVLAIPSLGRQRYFSALACADLVIGNSSSGIIEVPSAGIPTVDIGIRQRGRIAGPSVVHCAADTAGIAAAIKQALGSGMRAVAARKINPYCNSDTLERSVSAIADTPLTTLVNKKFHDIIPLQ